MAPVLKDPRDSISIPCKVKKKNEWILSNHSTQLVTVVYMKQKWIDFVHNDIE